MTKSEMMKKAIAMARTFVGDWSARMSLALKEVWKMAKAKFEMPAFDFKGSPKQIAWATEIVSDLYKNANTLYNHKYWVHPEQVRARIEKEMAVMETMLHSVTAGKIIDRRDRLYSFNNYINNYDCYLSNLENK